MERVYRILVVDDHQEIRDLLQRFLRQHGLDVVTASEGVEMHQRLAAHSFDLMILDLMLPGKDGITLCREVRSQTNLPIIMLTALGEDIDRIIGLEVGADDYIAKPFNPRELLARIKSVLRRHFAIPSIESQTNTPCDYYFAQWHLNVTRRELLSPKGELTPLTSSEFAMLLAFVSHPNAVLSRDDLLKLVQGRGDNVYDRAIDTLISRLRKKIELDSKHPTFIKTIWGGGYQFSCQVRHDN
ncbi:response regulator [Vibrio sp. AK197]